MQGNGGGSCFTGETLVREQSRGIISMTDVKIGDQLMTIVADQV